MNMYTHTDASSNTVEPLKIGLVITSTVVEVIHSSKVNYSINTMGKSILVA